MSSPLYPPQPRRRLPTLLPPLMAWALVAVLSLAAFSDARSSEIDKIHGDFRVAAHDRVQRVRERLGQSLGLTDELYRFWTSSQEVEPPEFENYTNRQLGKVEEPRRDETPAVVALEWAPQVRPEDKDAFEAANGFGIRDLDPEDGIEPGSSELGMFPITYVASSGSLEELLGLDLASERVRRETLEKAWQTGEAALTPPLELFQKRGDETGFLYVRPFYDEGEPKEEDLSPGFVLGVYCMSEIVDKALYRDTHAATDPIVLVLCDLEDDGPVVMHTHGAPSEASFTGMSLSEIDIPEWVDGERELDFHMPAWSVLALPAPDYVTKQRTIAPWMFLISGVLVATLLASLLWLKQNRASVLARANTLLRGEIREREAAEEALRENQRMLSTLMSNLPGAAYRARPEPHRPLEFLSEGCQLLTGYSRERLLSGEIRYHLDIVHPEDRATFLREFEASIAEKRPYRLEYRIRDGSGAEKWIWEQGRPVTGTEGDILALEGFLSDITPAKEAQLNRERMEVALRETQKLESLGILAGGIAHDFNNLLTGVLGNAEVALEMVGPSDAAREPLQQLLHAGRRARQLTGQLLAYAGRASIEREPVDLSEHLSEMIDLLQTAIPKKVDLRLQLQDDLPSVEADASQIQQLAMNLVLNAAEACDGGVGTVRVNTRLVKREAVRLPDGGHPDGPMVLFEVRDNGSGMDAATRQRMFDPFFTTKFTGRGLGLSAVLGIVRAHGGHLEVDTTPGRGTKMRVFLPASDKRPVSKSQTVRDDLHGNARVLVVDDEPLVLDVARRILERLGYDVETASDSRGALRWYRENWRATDAVILDMTMPGMSGREMLEEMRKINPDVRALIASGYLESEISAGFVEGTPAAFVQKPFSRQSLAGTLKDVLGQKAI